MYKNETKKQHFVSQAEQRLNAFNQAAKEENQKIYSYRITDKENFRVQIENKNGNKIQNNLSLIDLFSFDVVSKNLRSNFEKLFNQYESNIEKYTKALLNKLQQKDNNIKEELLYLFTCKLINSFRNPYCIKKTLNTIGAGANFYPSNEENAKIYKMIIDGKKPQQEHICRNLGITNEEYSIWLRSLFMMLMGPKNGNDLNILEEMIKDLFTNSDYCRQIHVHQYTNKNVLLSDRSYAIDDSKEKSVIFYFNLCSNAFVVCGFIDFHGIPLASGYSSRTINRYKDENNVSVVLRVDDLAMLEKYNQITIYQAYKNVFCSGKEIYGVAVD